jgi:hypothetical protein
VRRYFGHAGHFIGAPSCRFHLHTHVGKFCVSTVGDYYPRGRSGSQEPERIGLDRLYETMVFDLDDNDDIASYTELTCRGYNDAEDADKGHEEVVREYEAKS